MIYVLFQTGSDFECQPKAIYASHFKRLVEKKVKSLKDNQEKYRPFYDKLKYQYDIRLTELRNPPEPDLKNLPPRPLVWKNHQWNNAYILEAEEILRKNHAEFDSFAKKLMSMFNKNFKTKFKNFYELMEFMDDYSYSIEKVESD